MFWLDRGWTYGASGSHGPLVHVSVKWYGSFLCVSLIVFIFCREQPFIPYLDKLPTLKRNVDGPFMMPIVDKYSDMGTVVMGKVESGECLKGQTLAIYPNRVRTYLF